MNIIGMCGKGGSGKDTVADYLVENYDFHRVAAADAMKEDLCRYLDMDLNTLESIKNKKIDLIDTEQKDSTNLLGQKVGDFSIRRFLQLYGMDMRYRINDTYWLRTSIDNKIRELELELGATDNNPVSEHALQIVVSDVRFEIEFDFIKKNGGKIFYIEGRTGLTEEESNHVSEQFVNTTARDKCDMVIDNSQTVDDLYIKIKELMNDI